MDPEVFFGDVSPGSREPGAKDPGEALQRSFNDVFSLAYEELKRLARSVRHNDPGATLTPTAIVNETWIKLAKTPAVAQTSPMHFKRIAACAMRQVLVDAARRRHAQVRGGAAMRVTFDEAASMGVALSTDREVLALDAAIDTLARLQPRQAALVEARFFGGFETAEAAELLGISEATALRDWRSAKAWLAVEVRRALSSES